MPHVTWSRAQLEGCSAEKLRTRALDLREALGLSRPIPHTATSLIEWILANQGLEETITPIDKAHEGMLDIGGGISLWYRTWGKPTGIPALFVHGGPGNCVADYKDVNAKFFDPTVFFVIEVDQRGTGYSTPSVRESAAHMKRYLDISIEQMSADFERVRKALRVQRWLVFGGTRTCVPMRA